MRSAADAPSALPHPRPPRRAAQKSRPQQPRSSPFRPAKALSAAPQKFRLPSRSLKRLGLRAAAPARRKAAPSAVALLQPARLKLDFAHDEMLPEHLEVPVGDERRLEQRQLAGTALADLSRFLTSRLYNLTPLLLLLLSSMKTS